MVMVVPTPAFLPPPPISPHTEVKADLSLQLHVAAAQRAKLRGYSTPGVLRGQLLLSPPQLIQLTLTLLQLRLQFLFNTTTTEFITIASVKLHRGLKERKLFNRIKRNKTVF